MTRPGRLFGRDSYSVEALINILANKLTDENKNFYDCIIFFQYLITSFLEFPLSIFNKFLCTHHPLDRSLSTERLAPPCRCPHYIYQ